MDICGEITYGNVHSDICPGHNLDDMAQVDRDFLHLCLDEWLTRSNGEGFFWVGNPEQIRNNFNEGGTEPC